MIERKGSLRGTGGPVEIAKQKDGDQASEIAGKHQVDACPGAVYFEEEGEEKLMAWYIQYQVICEMLKLQKGKWGEWERGPDGTCLHNGRFVGKNKFHWFIMIQFQLQDILNFIAQTQKHRYPLSRHSITNGSLIETTLSPLPLLLSQRRGIILDGWLVGFGFAIVFCEFKQLIKLRKMEEFVEECYGDSKETGLCSQAPFIVLHGFRHFIAKRRRKALRRANNQRKQMLIHSASQANTQIEAQESRHLEKQCGDSLWDVFNVHSTQKHNFQLSSLEQSPQSQQMPYSADSSIQKGQISIGRVQNLRLKKGLFAQQFLGFSYSCL